MLGFFRKHQRYFFLIVTVAIIVSFSFFGTYSTLNTSASRDEVAFIAIDGTQVTKSELDRLVMFINTDAEDKLLFGGMWGPNFLNDGILKKSFLQTGLFEILAKQFQDELKIDMTPRHEKEKRYSLYTHPQAQFLSVETVWNYMAPEIRAHFDRLRHIENPASPEAISERVQLFLAEKKLPAPLVRQVLLYQQQQYGWLTPDPNLERLDFSLFGYHTLEDWFGPRMVRLAAEFIINASILAEQKGYQVSKADALADLMRNAEISFKQNLNNPNLGVRNSSEYYNEQLNRMQLDPNQAAAIWTQVMLFRRLFDDVGNSVFVDPFMFQQYNSYAMETVEGDLYRLPPNLRFGSYREMQKFEIYLNAISHRNEEDKNLLSLPAKFYSPAEMIKKNPALVQKRYLLDIASVDITSLQNKIGLRETWNWETETENWDKLKKQFPDLGAKKGDTREERFGILDQLDDKTRTKIDAFARHEIVASHPEWLLDALNAAESHQEIAGIPFKGGKTLFAGLKNPETLMKLLDQAAIGKEDPALSKFSADQLHYYHITVLDRSHEPEILTFPEAQKDQVLDQMLDRTLEAYYLQIRESHPKEFQKTDQSWKPFADVKDQAADLYFAKLLKDIQSDYAKAISPSKAPAHLISDISASLRFYHYFNEFLDKAKKDPNSITPYLQPPQTEIAADTLPPAKNLADQWKLEKSFYQSERGSESEDLNLAEIFAMQPNTWSSIQTPANGDLNLFYLNLKGSNATAEALDLRIESARHLLSQDVQQVLMQHLLQQMTEKKAFSLEYMNRSSDASPTDNA